MWRVKLLSSQTLLPSFLPYQTNFQTLLLHSFVRTTITAVNSYFSFSYNGHQLFRPSFERFCNVLSSAITFILSLTSPTAYLLHSRLIPLTPPHLCRILARFHLLPLYRCHGHMAAVPLAYPRRDPEPKPRLEIRSGSRCHHSADHTDRGGNRFGVDGAGRYDGKGRF